MKLTSKKVQTLLKNNDVYTPTLTNWDRVNNRNCKFIPGDKVQVSSKRNKRESCETRDLHGMRGVVIAVSSADGYRINTPNYKSTRYFVARGNKVWGFWSESLKAI